MERFRPGAAACKPQRRRLSPAEEKLTEASNMVGGIVEKGFAGGSMMVNSATAPPTPTVVPFPVARHRSDGPHWSPLPTKLHEVEEDDEEKDLDDFESLSRFAHAVPRKQKKGLDFSRWREMAANDLLPAPLVKEKNDSVSMICDNKDIRMTFSPDRSSHSSELSVSNTSGSFSSTEQIDFKKITDSVENHLHTFTVTRSYDADSKEDCAMQTGDAKEWKQACIPYMDGIDGETSTILQKMSFEDILDAREEIEKKLRPDIINMLRKRGKDKIKRRESFKADKEAEKKSDSSHGEFSLPEKSSVASQHSTDPNFTARVDSNTDNKSCVPENIGCQPFVGSDSSKWNVWARRVERVRVLRFSLDGNVVDTDTSLDPASGASSANVSERDILRTEGDPSGAGYTIKEAVTLIRSTVPGQRALALQLIASILDKAIFNLQFEAMERKDELDNPLSEFVDSEAIWAYLLGPEPDLVLSLRIALDDNNLSVLLPCVKVIQCLLSCAANESFFKIQEKLAVYYLDMYTAPIFRSRPEIDLGFLHGGFWKYSAKSSSLLPFTDEKEYGIEEGSEGERTIKDDVVVAGQDVAAGFIRMGILERISYLLEVEQYNLLEEHLIPVVTELARHSPSSSNAVVKCPKLLASVVNRLSPRKDLMDVHPVMVKALCLLKVLAKSDRQNCEKFIRSGIFLNAMSHLYKYAFSKNNLKAAGNEQQKLASLLMMEQLSFWRVFIHYGYCISYFSDFFGVLCFWLNPPDGGEFPENGKSFGDYALVSREAYLTLGALSRRLPYLHKTEQINSQSVSSDNENNGIWFWSHVPPVVELAKQWFSLTDNKYLLLLLDMESVHDAPGFSVSGLLWVLSSVLEFLSNILARITHDPKDCEGTRIPWLPDFVPKIVVELVKSGLLKSNGPKHSGKTFTGKNSLFEILLRLRHHHDYEVSLSSACCLRGLVHLMFLLDECIQVSSTRNKCVPKDDSYIFEENVILENEIIMTSRGELKNAFKVFTQLVCSEWSRVQYIEIFGRGGPAPGVGFGWGAPNGGFWSKHILLARVDAQMVMDFVRVFQAVSVKQDIADVDDVPFALEMVQAALAVSWIAVPTDIVILEEALTFLVLPSILQCLTSCIDKVLVLKQMKPLQLCYEVDDFLCFSKKLRNHFTLRWLTPKRKKTDEENKFFSEKRSKVDMSLQTIPEDADPADNCPGSLYVSSMMVQWAHQRLPLPLHWFLSPISTVCDAVSPNSKIDSVKKCCLQPSADVSTVVHGGLLLLLGLESMSMLPQSDFACSLVHNVPLVWKLHSLSMTLIVKSNVLEDSMTRDIYIALQEMYNQLLVRMSGGEANETEALTFKSDIHENYPAFVETLTEQFAAVSYGDVIYGRQVALYLLRCVEEPIRLAVWKTLTNSRALELLPHINECLGTPKGYLEPLEDSEAVLDTYAKTWTSGFLNKAFERNSMTFMLALHNLSSFIFHSNTDEKLQLRKSLARSLIRWYSINKKQEGMMLALINYQPNLSLDGHGTDIFPLSTSEIELRMLFLKEACELYSSLYPALSRLKELV